MFFISVYIVTNEFICAWLGPNQHPYDPKIDKTINRLSKSNKSIIVALHDSVVLDSSIVHIEFIVNSVVEPVYIASDSEKN